MRHITEEGLELIKRFEGFLSKSYICPAGYKTIGYGHLIGRNENFSEITEREAENLLLIDIDNSEKSLKRLIMVALEDNQFNALVDFCFNLGGGSLQRSTLRNKLNREEYEEAADELPKWCYARGLKLKGLYLRRLAERALFLKDL
jgi:lysozyme